MRRQMGLKVIVGLLVIACVGLAGCSAKPDLVGMWQDADGTVRTFAEDGTCQNIAMIDIGGSRPTYVLSDSADGNGRYSMYVEQGGYNGTTFYVEAVSADEVNIYSESRSSEPLYRLTRQ